MNIKNFHTFSHSVDLVSIARMHSTIGSFANEVMSKSPNQAIAYHGTTPEFVGFDADYEREESDFDFELPVGLIFLSSDFREAATYNTGYVVPCVIDMRNVLVVKVDSINPSDEFDKDFSNPGGHMFSEFVNEGYSVLEVRGINKSTYITYENTVKPNLELAKAWNKSL